MVKNIPTTAVKTKVNLKPLFQGCNRGRLKHTCHSEVSSFTCLNRTYCEPVLPLLPSFCNKLLFNWEGKKAGFVCRKIYMICREVASSTPQFISIFNVCCALSIKLTLCCQRSPCKVSSVVAIHL